MWQQWYSRTVSVIKVRVGGLGLVLEADKTNKHFSFFFSRYQVMLNCDSYLPIPQRRAVTAVRAAWLIPSSGWAPCCHRGQWCCWSRDPTPSSRVLSSQGALGEASTRGHKPGKKGVLGPVPISIIWNYIMSIHIFFTMPPVKLIR